MGDPVWWVVINCAEQPKGADLPVGALIFLVKFCKIKSAMRILIVGSKGMLGQELVRVFGDAGHEVAGWDKEEIDLTDATQDEKIRVAAPAVLINAAAYNNMDAAELPENKRIVFALNAEAPTRLANLAKEIGATFIHFSTDYVFGGESVNGYVEDATPKPISIYGESKFQSEQGVTQSSANFYLIRLSRLFGPPASSGEAKKSFVDIMVELGRTKEAINLVDEEKSCPTYAPDLAAAVLSLVTERAPFGIYHLANSGACTWFEFGQEIFKLTGSAIIATPVASSVYPRPARRPATSELKNTKRPLQRAWQIALAEYLHSK